MTHAAVAEKAQLEAGITPTLLRLSIGIEHIADLVADISAGLERVKKSLQAESSAAPLKAVS